MKENEQFDEFIASGAKANAIMYTVPICLMVIFLHLINVQSSYIFEVILIYLIGTISHTLAWGFQALNAQIDLSTRSKSKS
jgi:hypothetical protein